MARNADFSVAGRKRAGIILPCSHCECSGIQCGWWTYRSLGGDERRGGSAGNNWVRRGENRLSKSYEVSRWPRVDRELRTGAAARVDRYAAALLASARMTGAIPNDPSALPNVANHVEQLKPVRSRSCRQEKSARNRRIGCCGMGIHPARRSGPCGARRVPAHRPRRTHNRPSRPKPQIPIAPQSVASCRPRKHMRLRRRG